MRIGRNNTENFASKHSAETTVRKMTLGKVSWRVLMAVWLLAMADAEDDKQEVSRLSGPSDLINFVGTEADFICTSPLENCVGMTWYRHIPGTDRETIVNECGGIYLRDKYTVKDFPMGCRLIVKNAELNDTGFVICQIRISRSNLVEGRGRFIVVINDTKHESHLKGLENSFNVVGSNATFTCVSPFKDCSGMAWFTYKPGNQEITVYDWFDRNYLGDKYRDKYIVENATWSCQLTVTNIDLADAGYVGCSIRISGKPFRATASLTVITY